MEHVLANILGKPDDYKVCKHCHKINWYANEECIECGSKEFFPNESRLNNGKIEHSDDRIIKIIEGDYEYYKSEGWEEGDIDDILTDV